MRQSGRAHKLTDRANKAEILRLAPLRPCLEAVGEADALRDPLAQGGAKGVRLEVRTLQVALQDPHLPAERACAALRSPQPLRLRHQRGQVGVVGQAEGGGEGRAGVQVEAGEEGHQINSSGLKPWRVQSSCARVEPTPNRSRTWAQRSR